MGTSVSRKDRGAQGGRVGLETQSGLHEALLERYCTGPGTSGMILERCAATEDQAAVGVRKLKEKCTELYTGVSV